VGAALPRAQACRRCGGSVLRHALRILRRERGVVVPEAAPFPERQAAWATGRGGIASRP